MAWRNVFHVARVLPAKSSSGAANANGVPKPLSKSSVCPTAVPVPPSDAKRASAPALFDTNATRPASGAAHSPLSFVETFGKLGVPMLFVLLTSIVWTVWLIVLTIDPNGAANYLTNTAEFDGGEFWLIIDPDPVFMAVSVFSLVVLALAYFLVVLQMTLLRNSVDSIKSSEKTTTSMCSTFKPRFKFTQKVVELWHELTAFNGRKRKFWNALLKVLDLTIQTTALYRLLEDGVPTTLCYTYAGLIAANSLSCAVFILSPALHSAFAEVFVDTIFDMLFAVGWPILWLAYSITHFQFDRAKALLILQTYPPAWFERRARLAADASEVTLFQISFDALRMKSGSDLCLRMAMNLSFCYRLKRVVEYLIRQRRRTLHPTQSRDPSQFKISRSVAAFFVAVSAFILMYVHQSIALSSAACEAFPQCVAFAYRWQEHGPCACRALIDSDRAPRTYAEWIHPVDVTDVVSQLATSGDLRVLQLTNRQLPVWPEQLQRCTDLRTILLLYTGIGVIPDRAAKFTKLEFLNINGRAIDSNLVTLPESLFDDMATLTFFHLAVHQNLARLPSMDGLTNLKSFSVNVVFSLEDVPPLDTLSKLQRVQLGGSRFLERIPDLAPSARIVDLVVVDIPACCDGYIGACNLSHYLCASRGSCLATDDPENHPSQVTQQLIDLFAVKTCLYKYTAKDFFVSPTQEDVDVCNGVLYAECRKFNSSASDESGMCYNERMQVIACQTMAVHKNARMQEILHGVGQPCDPIVEKWLGCVA